MEIVEGRTVAEIIPKAQPLDGGEPKRLVELTDGQRIFEYAWSKDGIWRW